MKTQISFISFSVFLALSAQATEADTLVNTADNFGFTAETADKVNKKKWKCTYCVSEELWSGTWNISANNQSGDDAVFNNISDRQDGLSLDGAFNIRYRHADKYANIWYRGNDGNIDNPGLALGAELKYYSGAKFAFSYQEMARYYGNSGQTPFQKSGNDLTLPDHWQPNGNSSNMPLLSTSLNNIDLELLRDTLAVSFDYRGKSPWRPRVSMSQEEKKGTKLTSGYNNYNATILPESVDYTTTKFSSGLSYFADNFMSDVAYAYREFSNEQSTLNWQDPFSMSQQTYSLAPDNKHHQLSVKLRYRQAKTQYLMSGHYSQSLQDHSFANSTTITPVKSLDGRVDDMAIKFKALHRLNAKTRLTAKASFSERNNKTEQYLIGDRYTRVNDYRNTKMALTAQFKQLEYFNISIDASLVQKDRPQQERTRTDLQEYKVSFKEKTFDDLDFNFDYIFSTRDGSKFKYNVQARNTQNQALRRFHLADRDRNQVKSWFGYSVSEAFNVELSAYYAKDDYTDTEVGLTKGDEVGAELSFSGATSSFTWQLYYSLEETSYERAGSDNLGAANWWSVTDNSNDQFGFNIEIPDLVDDVLAFGLEYNYSKGTVEESVTQNRAEDYSDYDDSTFEQHRVDLYLDYTLSEKAQIKTQLIYERNTDMDYFYQNVDVDEISNLISSGTIGHNYNNTYLGVSYQRSF
jgi:MtrB/PioB family decaheme-associated outer membrane protein